MIRFSTKTAGLGILLVGYLFFESLIGTDPEHDGDDEEDDEQQRARHEHPGAAAHTFTHRAAPCIVVESSSCWSPSWLVTVVVP